MDVFEQTGIRIVDYSVDHLSNVANCLLYGYTNPNENQDIMTGLKISIVQHTLGHRDSSL